MKLLLRWLLLGSVVCGCFLSLLAQTSNREAFDNKLFAMAPLSHFGTSPKEFASLREEDKEGLLACREVLTSLFRGLDRGSQISQYLTPELARAYGDGKGLTDPETSILAVGVFDWNIRDDGKRIELRFFTVASAEGDWVLSKNVATLERSGSEWRVAAFRWNEK